MRIKIEVTEADIKAGRCGDPYGCPVAIAAMRRLNVPQVGVGSYIDFTIGGKHIEKTSPKSVTRFVCDFDLHKPVKPFAFTLNITATEAAEMAAERSKQ